MTKRKAEQLKKQLEDLGFSNCYYEISKSFNVKKMRYEYEVIHNIKNNQFFHIMKQSNVII